MEKLISFIGIIVMILIAYLLSEDKKNVDWRLVITGVIIQIIFGFLFLKWEPGQKVLRPQSRCYTTSWIRK